MREDEFSQLFDQLMESRRADMKTKFNRVLPSGELIFNRFDKAGCLHAGEDSSVYDTSVIMGDVEIGKHVWVGPYTILEGINARLHIGDFVSINAGVMIYTHDSTKYYLSGGTEKFCKGDVFIGNNVVIGTMSMISCGVTIGNHCVVGANSLVNSDIPDYSIAAGTPARIIGKVVISKNGKIEYEYFHTDKR